MDGLKCRLVWPIKYLLHPKVIYRMFNHFSFKVTRPYFIGLLQTFELSLLFFFSFPLFLLLVCFLKKFQLSTGFTESEPLYTLCNQEEENCVLESELKLRNKYLKLRATRRADLSKQYLFLAL